MITSPHNPRLKLIRSLAGRAKERRDAGLFLVEGVRLVEELIDADYRVEEIYFSEEASNKAIRLLPRLQEAGFTCEEVSGSVFRTISETEASQGILAVVRLPANDIELPLGEELVLIPDQIRDPGNLGTLLRSAAASGVQAVLIPPETTDAFAPKVVRSGMGAHFRLPIHSMSWEEIRKFIAGLQVFVADMDGQSCWDTDLSKPIVLIVGNEAEGASESAQKLANGKISIPMSGETESLNAGVAGSVLMFEVMRQRAVNRK